MSAPHRPFLRRFTLALLGMLLLMAVGFAGLGWMCSRDFGRVVGVVGFEKAHRLRDWYLVFMANLMPGDRDGDLVCDGAELFLGTDPRNPRSTLNFVPHCFSHSFSETFFIYCGERRATRWKQNIDFSVVRWPRGFRAVISANQPVLLPKNGTGAPTEGPLVVSVNECGEVEFDILAESSFEDVRVEFGNAANDQNLGRDHACFPGWRTPPIPVSIDGGPPDATFQRGVEGVMSSDVFHQMKWAAPTGWTGDYVIEAAREESSGSWQPVQEKAAKTEWTFNRSNLHIYFPDYTGPLKFRVVPVSPTPP